MPDIELGRPQRLTRLDGDVDLDVVSDVERPARIPSLIGELDGDEPCAATAGSRVESPQVRAFSTLRPSAGRHESLRPLLRPIRLDPG